MPSASSGDEGGGNLPSGNFREEFFLRLSLTRGESSAQ